jgi:hypothetical protein
MGVRIAKCAVYRSEGLFKIHEKRKIRISGHLFSLKKQFFVIFLFWCSSKKCLFVSGSAKNSEFLYLD